MTFGQFLSILRARWWLALAILVVTVLLTAVVSLSLTKALVEANRAKFQIKTGSRSGTLIEIVFPHAVARA